jgi:succinyl-diaminopimelate desuccinylase
MDCRILPRYTLTEVMAVIEEITKDVENQFSVKIEISHHQYVEPAPPTSPDAPVVIALERAIEKVYGLKAFAGGVGAGTVAACLRKKGYPTAVWSKTDMNAHQPDENCLIDNMLGNAKVFAYLFLFG